MSWLQCSSTTGKTEGSEGCGCPYRPTQARRVLPVLAGRLRRWDLLEGSDRKVGDSSPSADLVLTPGEDGVADVDRQAAVVQGTRVSVHRVTSLPRIRIIRMGAASCHAGGLGALERALANVIGLSMWLTDHHGHLLTASGGVLRAWPRRRA